MEVSPLKDHLAPNSPNIFMWPKHKLVHLRTAKQEIILVA